MTSPETDLFTATELRGLTLRNRIFRSATWEGLADKRGCVTQRLVDLYRELAEGGCGLLISSFTNVLEDGSTIPGSMGLFHDRQNKGVGQLAEAVHQANGKLCLQLVHGGGQASSKLCGGQPLAPSAVETKLFPELPREMTLEDIKRTVAAFAAAAQRAKQSGCDAVQLHAAHGYLLSQFLSPHTNRRQDQYGGDIKNRSRFLLEVVEAVQNAVGKGYPLLVKLNGCDNLADGLTLEDATKVAKLLDTAGIAAIEVSGGTPISGDMNPVRMAHESGDEMAYNVILSRTIRQQVDCPIIAVGGIRSLHVMSGLLKTGQTDYISLSRPLIREPDLPNKLQSDAVEKSTCTSCNGCFKAAMKGEFRCVIP